MHSESSPPEGLLEQELGHALRRVEAPEGFAESLLRRLDAERSAHATADVSAGPLEYHATQAAVRPAPAASSATSRAFRFRRLATAPFSPTFAGLAAALLLILLLPVAGYLHQRREQARAEAAAQQFTLAMRLTQAALLDAGQHIAEHARARDPQ